jgi:hypothetical protein
MRLNPGTSTHRASVDLVIRPTQRRRLAQRCGWICRRILVRDKELRARLTLDYQPFYKRQGVSGDYYRRISKPNASFVSEPLAEPHDDDYILTP